MNFHKTVIIIFLTFSPILSGSTSTQKSIPAKIDSQMVSLSIQVIDTLVKKVERLDSLLQKQALQTVNTPKENWWKVIIGWIKDSKILSFIAGIIGTILTFKISNKSLLNPLRTEVIKKQIELFSELIKIIDGQLSISFLNIIEINVVRFLSYFDIFREEIWRDEYLKSLIVGSHMGIQVDTSDRIIKNEFNLVTKEHFFNEEIKFDTNNKFILEFVNFDKNTRNANSKIYEISKNPFLPKSIKNTLKKLIDNRSEIIKNSFAPILEREFNSLIEFITKGNDSFFKDPESVYQIFKTDNIPVGISGFKGQVYENYYKSKISDSEIINELRDKIYRHLKIESLLH